MEEATPNLFSLIRHWLQQATTSIVYTMFPNVLNHSQLLAESLNNFTRITKTLVPSRNKAEFCRESALVSWTNLVAFSYQLASSLQLCPCPDHSKHRNNRFIDRNNAQQLLSFLQVRGNLIYLPIIGASWPMQRLNSNATNSLLISFNPRTRYQATIKTSFFQLHIKCTRAEEARKDQQQL